MKIFFQKCRRRLHRFLVSLLPESEYKRKWQNFYNFWWRFELAGYKLEVGKSIRIFNDNFSITGKASNTIWTSFGVLCDHEYDFFDSADYVMIDIGLNIGVASLWFARKKNIVKIYGYEPFLDTYQQAVFNLDANRQLKDKITIFNFGLGDSDKEISVHYNADLPGSMSTMKDLYKGTKLPIERVQIKKTSDVLKPIFAQNRNLKKFVKIGCEGSEVEILSELNDAGVLSDIDLILLEWHFGNNQSLIDILSRNHFLVLCNHVFTNQQGNIAAMRVKS